MKYSCVYVFLFVVLFMSCDPSGNISFTSGYEYKVRFHSIHEYNGEIIDLNGVIYPEMVLGIDARQVCQ
jgi:hypothetical protein